MKRRERIKGWADYTRDLANKMELRDWVVYLRYGKTKKNKYGATVYTIYGRKIARIKLHRDFDTFSPEDQRHFIVHELIHVHFFLNRQLLADARKNRPKHWIQFLELNARLGEELGVDALADVIAPFMPLPDVPAKAKKKRGNNS